MVDSPRSTFDYIVVGAGSAGAVIASRLSEDPDVSVLLLEAGPPDDALMQKIPALWPSQFRSQYDWAHVSEPEPGLDGRRRLLSHGRSLGGSSSMNAMIYIRGNRADYDEWARLGGDGWDYESVLPYFKKAEGNVRGASEFHGADGPISVSDQTPHEISSALVAAGVEAGYRENDDFNGADQTGVGFYQKTVGGGLRCSTAVGYLRPAQDRPNLEIRTYSRGTRLLFEGNRAVGVESLRFGELVQDRAEREVIVSSGADNSAQLLMLSGIGIADELGVVGIESLVDLPVGRNVQDHVHIAFNYTSTVPTIETLAGTPEAAAQLEKDGTGPLASNLGEMGGFWHSIDGLEGPDIQLHSCPVLFMDEAASAATAAGFMIGPTLLRPAARGQITLRTADPTTDVRILHNYLADEQDIATALRGMRAVLEIGKAPALAPYIKGAHSVPTGDSDAELLQFAKERMNTLWHPVGSCSIGAVVDAELRVLGVEGLRVADASVMPAIPRGNTNAASIMVGEKCADLIKTG